MARLFGRGRYATGTYPERSGGGGVSNPTLAEVLVNGNVTDGENIEISSGDEITDENPGDGLSIRTKDDAPGATIIVIRAGDLTGVSQGAAIGLLNGSASSGGRITVFTGGGIGAGVDSGALIINVPAPGAGGVQGYVGLEGPGSFLGLAVNTTMDVGTGGGTQGLWGNDLNEVIWRDFLGVDHPLAYAEFMRVHLSAPQAFVDGVPVVVDFDVIDQVNPLTGFGNLEPNGAFEALTPGLYFIQTSVTLSTGGTGGSGVLIGTNGPVNVGTSVLVSGAAAFNMTGTWIAVALGDEVSLTVTIVGASGNIDTATMLIWKVR